MIMEKKRYKTEEEMILWNEISKSLNYNKDRIDNVLFDEEKCIKVYYQQ